MKKIKTFLLTLTSLLLIGNLTFNNEEKTNFIGKDDYQFDNEETFRLNNHRFLIKDQLIDLTSATVDSSKISTPKMQYKINDDETCTARFVSALGVESTSIDYKEIGYNVKYYYQGKVFNYSAQISTVFRSVTAGEVVYNKDNISSIFNESNNYSYFVTYSLLNIPLEAFKTNIEVQPYVIDSNDNLFTSMNSKEESIYGNNVNVDRYKQDIIEFEDSSRVELIDNSEFDTLSSAATYTGSNQNLVRDLASYPGRYAPSGGDFIRCVQPGDQFKFNFFSDGGKADLILRGSTNNGLVKTTQDNRPLYKIGDVNLSSMEVELNGQKISIPQNVKFTGTQDGYQPALEKSGYEARYLYCLFEEVNLGEIELNQGQNEILITVHSSGHFDALKINYKDTIQLQDTEEIKIEAEDLTLKGGLKVTEDNALWPEAVSSNGKYVQSIVENDTMTYTFNSTHDGFAKFIISGSSNNCLVNHSSTPKYSKDMLLKYVMKVKVNGMPIQLFDYQRFQGTIPNTNAGDRRVLTNYQEVDLVSFAVENNKEYKIEITFTLSGDGLNYKHAYGGEAYGNYDYFLLKYSNN